MTDSPGTIDYFQRLKEDAATGLDLSPGNANSAWAMQEIEALRARVVELAEVLEGLIKNLDKLIAESHGVDGLHLNGDVAPWDSLLADGEYPWLEALDPARTVLAATPAQALKRARVMKEVVSTLEQIAQFQRDKCENAGAEILFMLLDNKVCTAVAALARLDALGKEK